MSKITRGHDIMGDRYKYDFRLCHYKQGWAQLDTRQDASYFGQWINPLSLKLFSYVEGDKTLTDCEDEADFIATVRECVRWHKEAGYFIGIDGMCHPPIIEAFTRMGLAEFLH
jgi:hypothetical protein